MRELIKLSNVFKTYKGRNFKVNALKDINLEIDSGCYCSIIGKSGSGKSSLLKILGLLDFEYEGSYIIFGKDFRNCNDSLISQYRKRIGFVFQDFQLVERYTIRKNLEVVSAIKFGKIDSDRIDAVLEKVGMLDKADSYPDELSGGQKQRVSIARAILSKPDLLIADEPTGSIDQENTTVVLDLIEELHQETGMTIIIVTHDMDVAMRAERVIRLEDGVIADDRILL